MKYPLLVLSACCVLFACQQPTPSPTPTEVTQTEALSKDIPEDFEPFYERFLRDSAYQMKHIVWPLRGHHMVTLPDSSASQLQQHEWTPADWVMHRPMDDSEGNYIREVQTMGDLIVIERIKVKAVNYGIERRFARQADTGEWALIYYSGIREM
ncbi:MAG TPA: hypothetical protein PK971_01640 [Saprospiraceae bacterium]|nr:hypothetical protein [Saprospiraceae bacterium]